jgi:hypothetical protein
MSLIIAIEPDRDQAAQLKDLVRRHTAAELILADTTDHAISAIGQRIPDLVLIPAFLSPQDDEALTNALRSSHGADHVQTLTIPVLGTPQTAKSMPQSVLSRLLGDQPRPAAPDSCDPKIFAEQITEYLERVAKDKSLPSNGNGHPPTASSGPKHNSGVRRPKVAAPPAPPAQAPPRHESRAGVRKAIPLPASNLPKPPEPPATDVAALEAALAQVALDSQTNKAAIGPSSAADESDALVMGLTSLMERLSAEDRAEASRPSGSSPAASASAPPASASPAPAVPPLRVEPAKTVTPPSVAAPPKTSPAAATDPVAWKELKDLESLEYAMPKNVLPRDDEKVEAAPTPQPAPAPAPSPAPAPKTSGASEWGDLMESLKKDLGQ